MNTRGSLWRPWDLHIHTPASFNWKGGGLFTNGGAQENEALLDELITSINKAPAAVFAIMDYWTFRGVQLLREYLRLFPDILKKTVFPGIELRCEAPADYRLNVHVLFSDTVSDQDLNDFLSSLSLTMLRRPVSPDALRDVARQLAPDKLKKYGATIEQVRADDLVALRVGSEVATVTKESLLQAVQGSNSSGKTALLLLPFDTYGGLGHVHWENHEVQATELMREADIFEARRSDHIAAFRGIRTEENASYLDNFLATTGKPKPVVAGSDAHRFSEYAQFRAGTDGVIRRTWIKADPTFHGILQTLVEPVTRVFIGDEPPILDRVRSRPTKYIDKVSIRRDPAAGDGDDWFDAEIEMNPGLVAIIGNKGSGKSALVDIVGLLGDSGKFAHFQFLKKFCKAPANLGRQFFGEMRWVSEEVAGKHLSDPVSHEAVTRVKYIPQNYLEEICNELKAEEGGSFDRELKAVIFSHVADEEKYDADTLDDLLRREEKRRNESCALLKADLHEVNQEIILLEEASLPERRSALERQLLVKDKELEAHEGAKPQPVPDPTGNPEAIALASATADSIDGLQARIGALEDKLKAIEDEKVRAIRARDNGTEALRIVRDCETYVKRALSRLSPLLGPALAPDEILRIEVHLAPLEKIVADNDKRKAELDGMTDPARNDSVTGALAIASNELKSQQATLQGPEKAYREYQRMLRRWTQERSAVIGDEATAGSIEWIRGQIKALDRVPEQLTSRRARRSELVRGIHGEIAGLAESYRSLYRAVQTFASSNRIVADKLKIEFDVILSTATLPDSVFGIVGRGPGAAFSSQTNSEWFVASLRALDPFDSGELIAFLDGIAERLRRRADDRQVSTETQMKRGRTTIQLYDFLFGLDFLRPQYTLKLDGKSLDQLSPGERGALLLVFYLAVDKQDIPLVMDQPEENLDNRTIFTVIGECIKQAKERRQVIMVTHNPNLAVACDADQVIVATHEIASGNKIRYAAGTIEDPKINAVLLDVLEGTRPAFENRDEKYI